MSEVNKAVETLKTLRRNAVEKAERLMQEIVELEEYAARLEPIISMAENLPELGATLLEKVQPPTARKRRETLGSAASKEKMFVFLREKMLTVKELALSMDLSESYVGSMVKECIEDKLLDKHPRWDGRLSLRIIDEEVRVGKVPN